MVYMATLNRKDIMATELSSVLRGQPTVIYLLRTCSILTRYIDIDIWVFYAMKSQLYSCKLMYIIHTIYNIHLFVVPLKIFYVDVLINSTIHKNIHVQKI